MYRPSQKIENQTSCGFERETVRKRFDDISAKGQVTCNEARALTAAIYAPLLLRNHEPAMDIRKQINDCWNFCNKRGWKVRYVFIDGCRSETSKSDFHDIVEKTKEQNLDVVVFCKFDQLDVPKINHVRVKRVSREVGCCVLKQK